MAERMKIVLRGLAMASLLLLTQACAESSGNAAPEAMAPIPASAETIVLAGGCFWGVEAVFEHTRGVLRAVSGYAGGSADSAHYELVSSGTTGHAEAVQVSYDPAQVSLEQLLDIYFLVAHDPTQLDYQGPDHGPQYRSAIFYAAPGQRAAAERKIAELGAARVYTDAIVTTLEPLREFYPAEAYHQDFAARHPSHRYIVVHDAPKVAKLKQTYPALYRQGP